jgi:isopentenyl-diphosphate delta-isomerase
MKEVILVDENDVPAGTIGKIEAHQKALLHRAFSVFIFNDKGEMLLHRRAKKKYHSGDLWSNACCSHPQPGEDTAVAAGNRLFEEMGIRTSLKKAFDFVYKASFDNGLIEYEFDHVFTGTYNGEITPDPDEVSDYCFQSTEEIRNSITTHPQKYTEWFKIAFPMLMEHHAEKSPA